MLGLVFDVETEIRLERHELYFPPHKIAVGHKVVRWMRQDGLERRFLGLESETVKMWRECPETYPKEYRRVGPLLLGSVRRLRGREEVPYLFWNVDRVLVHRIDLRDVWGNFPVLLASVVR